MNALASHRGNTCTKPSSLFRIFFALEIFKRIQTRETCVPQNTHEIRIVLSSIQIPDHTCFPQFECTASITGLLIRSMIPLRSGRYHACRLPAFQTAGVQDNGLIPLVRSMISQAQAMLGYTDAGSMTESSHCVWQGPL